MSDYISTTERQNQYDKDYYGKTSNKNKKTTPVSTPAPQTTNEDNGGIDPDIINVDAGCSVPNSELLRIASLPDKKARDKEAKKLGLTSSDKMEINRLRIAQANTANTLKVSAPGSIAQDESVYTKENLDLAKPKLNDKEVKNAETLVKKNEEKDEAARIAGLSDEELLKLRNAAKKGTPEWQAYQDEINRRYRSDPEKYKDWAPNQPAAPAPKNDDKDDSKDDEQAPEPEPEIDPKDIPEEFKPFLNTILPNGQPFAEFDSKTGMIKISPFPDKNEFMKASGGRGFLSRIDTLLDVVGAFGGLFGVPIPLGKIADDIAQNNLDDAYDALADEYKSMTDTFSNAVGQAAGSVVGERAGRESTKETAKDQDFLDAKTALAKAKGDWTKLEDEQIIKLQNEMAKDLATHNKDLQEAYQQFFSGIAVKQQAQILNLISQNKINEVNMMIDQLGNGKAEQFGRLQKQMDSDSYYSGGFKGFVEGFNDVSGAIGNTAGTAIKAAGYGGPMPATPAPAGNIGGSDKNIKSFALPKMFH